MNSTPSHRITMRFSFIWSILCFLYVAISTYFIFKFYPLQFTKLFQITVYLIWLVYTVFSIIRIFTIAHIHLKGDEIQIIKMTGRESFIKIHQFTNIKSFKLSQFKYYWLTYQNSFQVKEYALVVVYESVLSKKMAFFDDIKHQLGKSSY